MSKRKRYDEGDVLRVCDRGTPFYGWQVKVTQVDEIPPSEALLKLEVTAPTFYYLVASYHREFSDTLYFHHNQLEDIPH